MNSRQRFLAAMRGEKVDRPPTAHVSAMTTVQLQKSTGCMMPDVHLDAEKLVRLCGANHDVLGFDAVTFIINYFNEPVALGCSVDWGGPSALPVYTSHPWKTPEDATIPRGLLKRPPVSTYLDALRIAKRDYGDRCAVLGKVMGPFSMTMVMHGLENLMVDVVQDPDTVKHFLDVAVDVLVECGKAQFDVGIDALAIGEGGAGANMLSPKMYDDILLEAHQQMLGRLKGPTIMHICGDITPRLGSLRKIGLDCFNFDWDIAPPAMKSASSGDFRLMGNINTGDLLRATPDVIACQVRACLDAGIDIISPGCAISPDCPSANLKAIPEAVR